MKLTSAIAVATLASMASATPVFFNPCSSMTIADMAKVVKNYHASDMNVATFAAVACVKDAMQKQPLVSAQIFDVLCREDTACILPKGNEHGQTVAEKKPQGHHKRFWGFSEGSSREEVAQRMTKDKISVGPYAWGYQVFIPFKLVKAAVEAPSREALKALFEPHAMSLESALDSVRAAAWLFKTMNSDGRGIIVAATELKPDFAFPSPAGSFY